MTTRSEITAALSDLINELDGLYAAVLDLSRETRNHALDPYRALLARALVEEEEANSED
jgi:hypothetical protein